MTTQSWGRERHALAVPTGTLHRMSSMRLSSTAADPVPAWRDNVDVFRRDKSWAAWAADWQKRGES